MTGTKVSYYGTLVNVINATLGAGILSIPWSMAGASILSGVFLLAFGLTINLCSNMVYIYVSDRTGATDSSAIAGQLPGNLGIFASKFSISILGLGNFCCLICYEIVFSDCISMILPQCPRWLSITLFTIIASSLCMVPEEYLSITSSFSVGMTFYMIILMVFTYFFSHESRNDICTFGISTGTISMASGFNMAIVIQMITPGLYANLDNKSPETFQRIMATAFTFVFFIFATFGITSYLMFGKDVKSNILLEFPRNIFGYIGIGGVSIVVLSVYPLILNPIIEPFLDKEYSSIEEGSGKPLGTRMGNRSKKAMYVTTLSSAALCISFFVTDLGIVNVICGALSAICFLFITPSLLALHFFKLTQLQELVIYGFMCFGSLSALAAFCYTDNFTDSLTDDCLWS